MTETDWLAAADPEPMLRGLTPPPSERKLRLFALAWCGRIDHLITDARSRAALAFVTSHVETTPNRKKGRPAVEKAAKQAHDEAYDRIFRVRGREVSLALAASNAADAAHSTMDLDPLSAAIFAAAFAVHAACWAEHAAGDEPSPHMYPEELRGPMKAAQAELLREVLGNPFHRVAVDPLWLRWNDGTVGKVAEATYAEAAFDRLGVLADALEDAGCADDAILGHLRSPGPHVRGCWALDLLLGKG